MRPACENVTTKQLLPNKRKQFEKTTLTTKMESCYYTTAREYSTSDDDTGGRHKVHFDLITRIGTIVSRNLPFNATPIKVTQRIAFPCSYM